MPRAVLIVGLCGCGKSHMAQDYATQGYVCLDESFEGRRFAADPGKNLSTDKLNELKKQLAQGSDCAFTEAMLMFEKERQEFEPCLKQLQAMKVVTAEWVFFANGPEAANHNCRNDPNRKDTTGVEGHDRGRESFLLDKGTACNVAWRHAPQAALGYWRIRLPCPQPGRGSGCPLHGSG